jgi:hypothetical protein
MPPGGDQRRSPVRVWEKPVMAVTSYVALLLIIVVVVAIAMARPLVKSPFERWLTLGLVLSVIRIAALWFLQYHEWNRSQSLSYLPLVFLLVPESLPVQRLLTLGPAASGWDIVAFSLMLVAGSFLMSTVVWAAAWISRRVLGGGVPKCRGAGDSSEGASIPPE